MSAIIACHLSWHLRLWDRQGPSSGRPVWDTRCAIESPGHQPQVPGPHRHPQPQLCLTLCDPMDSSLPGSMGSPMQGYWSGLPFLSPGDLASPQIESTSLGSPALAKGFFTHWATWEALGWHIWPPLCQGHVLFSKEAHYQRDCWGFVFFFLKEIEIINKKCSNKKLK